MKFLVPKFHVYAHGGGCLRRMHPGVNTGCGMTEGETSERQWSYLGLFSL